MQGEHLVPFPPTGPRAVLRLTRGIPFNKAFAAVDRLMVARRFTMTELMGRTLRELNVMRNVIQRHENEKPRR